MSAVKLNSSLIYILEGVFKLPKHSACHRALHGNMHSTPEDFIMEADNTIDNLAFKGNDRKTAKILPAGAGLLKTFKQLVAHQQL